MIVNDIGLTKDSYSNIYTTDGNEIGTIYDQEGHVIYYMYRDTIGDGSRAFISYGAPIKDYKISGETLQDGTPSPDMPVDVVGCGVRTGNLAPDVGWIDGYVNYLGGINAADNVRLEKTSVFIPLLSGVSVVYSYRGGSFPDGGDGAWRAIAFYKSDKSFISRSLGSFSAPLSVQAPDDTSYIRLSLRTYGQDVSNNMLNLGSTALPYAPYGYKLPLTVNGAEYPIYLGTVPTTRRIKKLVLTGEENNWTEYPRADSSTVPYLPLSNFKGASITNVKADIICTHYDTKSQINIQNLTNKTGIAGRTSIGIIIADELISTLADFKSYLAAQYANGTPVTVWYVLAEPETAVVNEPLMKIGDYADTISMAQAGVTIPTLTGTNTLTIDTPVKPSEIDLTGRLKTSGYGQLLDSNLTAINDSTGTPIFIR